MRLIILCLFLLLDIVPNAYASMPNLPPNATILLDCPFNSVGNPICNGQVDNIYNAGSIASVSSAPESPPNVYRYFRGASDLSGGTQLDFYYPQSTELYVGLVIRTSPIFSRS